ncbi:MAG: VPLPA-CTERM sorting domain-containing protein [Pseudomonadota bacterium]
MKRMMSILLAAFLIFAVAGPAAAYFDDLHLIRSIYTNAGTTEIGSDLGADVSTLTLANPLNDFRGDLIALSAFDGGDLAVGYWAHAQANTDFYATGLVGGTLTMYGRKQSAADGVMNATQALYAAENATTATIIKPDLGSYFNKFEVNGNNLGSMGSILSTPIMTASLADLATVGYVDQALYFFDYNGSSSAKNGIEVATIRTFLTFDGTTMDLAGDKIATVINPSAVPVPAAVWLLGSGLLGLIGIRRRNA